MRAFKKRDEGSRNRRDSIKHGQRREGRSTIKGPKDEKKEGKRRKWVRQADRQWRLDSAD